MARIGRLTAPVAVRIDVANSRWQDPERYEVLIDVLQKLRPKASRNYCSEYVEWWVYSRAHGYSREMARASGSFWAMMFAPKKLNKEEQQQFEAAYALLFL